MATFDQLKELFQNQEERDARRREKEKKEEEKRRKEDKEEVKEVIKSQMSAIKEDIKEIKAKQDQIEGRVMQSETRMEKKYDDMANKFGNLEKKVKEIEDRENEKKAKKIYSSNIWPADHPAGRVQTSNQPALQPAGSVASSSQSALQPAGLVEVFNQAADSSETNEKIYGVVRRARKTMGFSPITSSNIKEMMEDMNIENLEAGKKEVVKDYLRAEMAMPEEVIEKLKFDNIFQRDGGPEGDRLYVEFSEDNMPGIIFKYVKKMRKECNIVTFIPDAYRDRAAEMEKIAFEMRHATPFYSTKIRWGWGDLILERKVRGSREPYRSVNMPDLPPVDLMATPRVRLSMPTPTASPAPGRKARKRMIRSVESPNLSQPDFQ